MQTQKEGLERRPPLPPSLRGDAPCQMRGYGDKLRENAGGDVKRQLNPPLLFVSTAGKKMGSTNQVAMGRAIHP